MSKLLSDAHFFTTMYRSFTSRIGTFTNPVSNIAPQLPHVRSIRAVRPGRIFSLPQLGQTRSASRCVSTSSRIPSALVTSIEPECTACIERSASPAKRWKSRPRPCGCVAQPRL